MTREEAVNYCKEEFCAAGDIPEYAQALSRFQIEKIIEEIYNDFESRVCENCKHFYDTEEEWQDGDCPMTFIDDKTMCYCYKFEPKHETT